MPSYLLLRNNKESGPLSREQLLQLGLRPYDLVWVEGRSAAWRYAAEVPELKDHAPVVEEQPYDRFFKRKPEEQKEQESAPVLLNNESVSVIMPRQAVPVKKEEAVFTPIPLPAPILAERPANIETKYSLPLDEIKERYVKQLQQRRNKTAQKKFIIQTLKKAAVFVAIIGSGVLIGFAIKSKNLAKNNTVNPPFQNVSRGAGEVSVKEEIMPASTNYSDATPITGAKEQAENSNNEMAGNKTGIVEKRKVNEEKIESPINPGAKPAVVNTESGERKSRNARNESKEKYFDKLSIPATGDISTFVSVKANNYKLRDFGGFRNLQLTVTNDSKFVLDHVLVELQYLKMNDEPVKIDHIPFASIEPGGSLTVQIPDNNRGAKLLYKITKIEPKDLNTRTAGM